MFYGDLHLIDILIFAGIAAFLFYRLSGVLGKKTGFEKRPAEPPIDMIEPIQKNETKTQMLRNKPTRSPNPNKYKFSGPWMNMATKKSKYKLIGQLIFTLNESKNLTAFGLKIFTYSDHEIYWD